MKVSYQHANPRRGQESYYIKFNDEERDGKMCILVDSGENVSVGEDLSDGEHLGGILLTHAHGDHYATLPQNVTDGTNIYASPDTGKILSKILNETGKHDNIGDQSNVMNSIQTITGWETIWDGVEIRPIPAGHAPGAVGYIIRFSDNGETNHILATGDFTFSSVAGNPGLSKEYPVDIDALFMNASVTGVDNESFNTVLNSSVKTIIEERIRNDDNVLVTASSLSGVHYGYLLGHIIEELELGFQVGLVGHTAKLYEDLGYDVSSVTTIPEFSDAQYVLSQADICIAGPCVPANNTSKNLFDALKNDTSASLVQILSGTHYDPIKNGRCNVHSFEYKAHPTQADIDEFVETVVPRELIIEHGRVNTYGNRYHFTITWSNRDYDEYTVYENGRWQSPHWINEDADQSLRESHRQRSNEKGGKNTVDFPAVQRQQKADLAREGIDINLIDLSTTAESESAVVESGESSDLQNHIDTQFKEVFERLENLEETVNAEPVTGKVVGQVDGGNVLVQINEEKLPEGDQEEITFHITNSENEQEEEDDQDDE